jgi:hypothetical protein
MFKLMTTSNPMLLRNRRTSIAAMHECLPLQEGEKEISIWRTE